MTSPRRYKYQSNNSSSRRRSPLLARVRVAHLFSCLCCSLSFSIVLFVFVLYFDPNIASVTRLSIFDCPFGFHYRLFLHGFHKKNKRKVIQSLNFMYRNINGVLPLHNCKFGDFRDRIYPIELEIKDITDIASYHDLHIDVQQISSIANRIDRCPIN